MRFHIIGNIHVPISAHYTSCAFTLKHTRLIEMLMSLGHEVYTYGAKSRMVPPPECTEFIETHTVEDIARTWGDGDNRYELGYDWSGEFTGSGGTDFRHDYNAERTPLYHQYVERTIAEINKRKKDDDFLLCMQGTYHLPIAQGVKLFLTCEPGIGYRGSVEGHFRAFESSYIMNFTYGGEHPRVCINGSYYDRVIPNYIAPDAVEYSADKSDYYLFIGRMIKRKGIITADLACRHLGKKLIIAGQGAHVDGRGRLVPNSDPDFILEPGTWEYVGYADVEKRKQLMAHAIATFVPTEYLEIFGGTHIESMLAGTPVITTSFGVFPGTIADVLDGMFHMTDIKHAVGFKCNTLQDFVEAAEKAKDVDPAFVRKYGERFLTDNVKWEYERWFRDIYRVYLSAMNPNEKGWHYVDRVLSSKGTPWQS